MIENEIKTYRVEKESLTAIANAIRAKTEKNGKLTLDQIATEIASIQAGSGGKGDPIVCETVVNISASVSVTAEDYTE